MPLRATVIHLQCPLTASRRHVHDDAAIREVISWEILEVGTCLNVGRDKQALVGGGEKGRAENRNVMDTL